MRVLDTVEDAPFTDKPLQQRQFERWRAFLRVMPSRAEVDAFVAAFPDRIDDGERALVADTFALLADAHQLAAPVRRVMFRAVDRMAMGMAAYTRRPSPLHLADAEDVTRYCCFVAGLVGEMLTDLWRLGHDEPVPAMKLAYHFGVFLQKVNILKDQREDEAAGRFLVPDRRALLASLRVHADNALAYLQGLSRNDRGFRVFCAWCLMLAATTLAQLDDAPRSRRSETAELLSRTAAIALDNEALERQFAELLPELPTVTDSEPHAKPESIAWFRATLACPLDDAELLGLGIASLRDAALAG
jgi:phytoene/squalene synthetase